MSTFNKVPLKTQKITFEKFEGLNKSFPLQYVLVVHIVQDIEKQIFLFCYIDIYGMIYKY